LNLNTEFENTFLPSLQVTVDQPVCNHFLCKHFFDEWIQIPEHDGNKPELFGCRCVDDQQLFLLQGHAWCNSQIKKILRGAIQAPD
jgi:hypothetical protein